MRHVRALAISLLLCALPSPVPWAADDIEHYNDVTVDNCCPKRGQLSGKLIGITILHGCPTRALIEEVQAKGQEMGADYTTIVEPAYQSYCPFTLYGGMWGFYEVQEQTLEALSVRVLGGEVVGLHFQVMK
jgi:hypothetical protein